MRLVPRLARSPPPPLPPASAATATLPEPAARVSEERALRAWLAAEDVAVADDAARADLVDALLTAKPGSARFLTRDRPLTWYRVALGPETLRALRPVVGPRDRLWRAASTDGTLWGVARRWLSDGPAPLAEAGVAVDRLRAYRDALADGATPTPVVVRTRRGATPWYVADGNHRVTAACRRRLDGARDDPLAAYVAVTANPVVRPLSARLRGAVRRLRGLLGRLGDAGRSLGDGR